MYSHECVHTHPPPINKVEMCLLSVWERIWTKNMEGRRQAVSHYLLYENWQIRSKNHYSLTCHILLTFRKHLSLVLNYLGKCLGFLEGVSSSSHLIYNVLRWIQNVYCKRFVAKEKVCQVICFTGSPFFWSLFCRKTMP